MWSCRACVITLCVFFFNDTATTEIYTLSLHDALPICETPRQPFLSARCTCPATWPLRSEEHTSELQSPCNLVCRLLLEKKTHTQSDRQHTRRIKSHRADYNRGVARAKSSQDGPGGDALGTVCAVELFFVFFLKERAPPETYPLPLPAPLPI